MSNLTLMSQSALAHIATSGQRWTAGEPAVVLRELTGLSLATVMARKGAEADLTTRVRERFAVDLPLTPRTASAKTLSFIWAGPAHWLAIDRGDDHSLETRLRDGLAGLASVCDQSGGRALVRISGRSARDVLAKGVAVDLHPRVFKPGDCAVTTAAHIGVHLWQVDEAPTFDCAVFRSFATSFFRWLVNASEEFDGS